MSIDTAFQQYYNSPLGWIQITATDSAVTQVGFVATPSPGQLQRNDLTERTALQLDQYFTGQRQAFDLPLATRGTEFQQHCWQALRHIPYGRTHSYGEQAAAIARPRAVRAVGRANGANPLAIVVPCHRVVGKNGTLTGYASGVERKAWLLAFEDRQRDRTQLA